MKRSSQVLISAIICTYNRSELLAKALEGLSKQSLLVPLFEVIVVDNASTDATERVTGDWKPRLPNLRYVFENQLGLSYARNTGARLAKAKYIAYLDDDAVPEPEWLASILKAFEFVCPQPFIVGGRVWLDWEGEPPDWLPKSFWALYSCVDYGNNGRFLNHDEFLAGANIAFRRDLLLDLGGFDTCLGRKGTSLISGEEAELLQKATKRNLPVYYEPRAVVRHFIPKERQRRRWLLKRVYWDGASQPILDSSDCDSYRENIRRRVGYDLKECLAQLTRSGGNFILGHRDEAFSGFLSGVNRLGRLIMELKLLMHSDHFFQRDERGWKSDEEENP